MGIPVKIKQRNIKQSYEFEFGKDSLSYAIKSFGVERSFSIPYETISMETERVKTLIPLFRRLTFVCFLLAIILSLQKTSTNETMASYSAVAGLIFAILYRLVRLGYTNYSSPKGKFSVMHDQNRELIETTIRENWIRRMKELHASVDPMANPLAEKNKIKWLKDKGVISEQEFNVLNAQIRENFPQIATPHGTIN